MWQQHLNFLTWPEILRQFGLCAGFGPPLKKRSAEFVQYHGDNEVKYCQFAIRIFTIQFSLIFDSCTNHVQ
jgi:hypothetical protein